MLARWILFASSYSPLFLFAAIRAEDATLARVLYVSAAVAALSLAALLRAAAALEPRQRMVVAAEDRGPDVAAYVATYLLPLLSVPDPTARDLVAYGGFVLLIGLVYVRSSMVAINPIAYVFRFRLTEVTTESGERQLLVSRRFPPIGRPISVRRVLPGLIVEFQSDVAVDGE